MRFSHYVGTDQRRYIVEQAGRVLAEAIETGHFDDPACNVGRPLYDLVKNQATAVFSFASVCYERMSASELRILRYMTMSILLAQRRGAQ